MHTRISTPFDTLAARLNRRLLGHVMHPCRMIAVDGDTLNAVNVGGVYMVLGPRKAPGGSTPPAAMVQ